MRREYDCAACGLCCTQYGAELHFYEEDIARWEAEGAAEILSRLEVVAQAADGWRAPDRKTKECACPFLTTDGGHRCSIYPTRPLVCRHFANGGSACRELRARHGLPVDDLP